LPALELTNEPTLIVLVAVVASLGLGLLIYLIKRK
jgi:hypothetical protein